jgi:hypothetical protein
MRYLITYMLTQANEISTVINIEKYLQKLDLFTDAA